MAPLIRFTLLGLYLALVAPLPVLAPPGAATLGLTVALLLGLVPIVALTSERVELDGHGIRVGHPPWCAWMLRRGWQMPWASISGLTPVTTSQGGRVYYVRSRDGSAWLLPQRVARFEAYLARFSEASGLDTRAVGRISPPWTYRLLAGLTAAMLAAELITAWLGPAAPGSLS
ncbi:MULTISPECIES: hypothetical protein [Aphanothece]|uniref:hypothetical protein n=1 Tax=Aphanothece TaxID=1121 RepID=UPI00398E3982